jgi:hypothetical protein
MSAKPWEEVAVNALEPAADAPITHAMAECSDSTITNLALRRPSEHISESSSTINVCGVMG